MSFQIICPELENSMLDGEKLVIILEVRDR